MKQAPGTYCSSRLISCAALLLCLAQAEAAVEMFIKIGDIEGESQDVRHARESDVLAWSWGMSSPPSQTTGGVTAGKVRFNDLHVTKWVDKATPGLMKHCSQGKHIDRAVLTIRKAGEKAIEFYKIVLEDVLVSGISTGGSGGEDRLTENISLNFARSGIEYVSITPTGDPEKALRFSWDLQKNVEGGVTFPDEQPPPPLQDTDNDGLPNEWEIAYNLNSNDPADANGDADGDGATNREEFIAGTSPRNVDEVFKATLSPSSGTPLLTWSSVAEKQYRVFVADSLDAAFQLHSTVPSAGTGRTSIPVPGGFATRFFRVEVVPAN